MGADEKLELKQLELAEGCCAVAVVGPHLGRAVVKALDDAARKIQYRAVILDLSAVQSVDSAALVRLVRLIRTRTEILFMGAALSPYALTIAQITRLQELLDIYAGVDAAVAALRSPREPPDDGAQTDDSGPSRVSRVQGG